MNRPTYEEMVPIKGDLDAESAWRIFGGLSIDDACKLFDGEGLNRTEDLMFMGSQAFCYYVKAAIQYLYSDASKDDEEMISGFVSTCEFKMEHELEQIKEVAPDIGDACRHILKRNDVFSPNYSDLFERLKHLIHGGAKG